MDNYFDRPTINSAKIILLLQAISIILFVPGVFGVFSRGGILDFGILISGLILLCSLFGIIVSPVAGFIYASKLLKDETSKKWGIVLIFSSIISFLIFLWAVIFHWL